MHFDPAELYSKEFHDDLDSKSSKFTQTEELTKDAATQSRKRKTKEEELIQHVQQVSSDEEYYQTKGTTKDVATQSRKQKAKKDELIQYVKQVSSDEENYQTVDATKVVTTKRRKQKAKEGQLIKHVKPVPFQQEKTIQVENLEIYCSLTESEDPTNKTKKSIEESYENTSSHFYTVKECMSEETVNTHRQQSLITNKPPMSIMEKVHHFLVRKVPDDENNHAYKPTTSTKTRERKKVVQSKVTRRNSMETKPIAPNVKKSRYYVKLL